MTDPHSPEAIEAEEFQMNASSPQQSPAEPFDDYGDGFDEVLPARPRARYLTPLTALLMALILGGVGFYVGIRVEKAQGSTSGGVSAFRGGFLGATGSTGKTGSTSRTGFPGGSSSLASRFAGAFGGAGGGTVGSVSSVSGNTIYVKETSGNTIKVKLSGVTKISKSESVSRKRLYPGDQVVISGSSSSNGTVHATSVTDSGASSTGSSASSSSSSSSSTGNNASAISSLFGGG
jgi:Domain of unknown function (DUF5666)